MSLEVLETEVGPIVIRRRRGRRRISIFMHPARPVEVRTNFSMAKVHIENFIQEKKEWIKKNLAEFSEQKNQFPEKSFAEGEELPLFGQGYRISFQSSPNLRPKMMARGREFLIFANEKRRDSKVIKKLIREFYRETAIRYLTQRVEALSARMSCFPKQLTFGEARNQWGSCHSSGRIRLNWKLIVFEPHLIDYIVIHELAHLKHMNHSPAFWRLVEEFCPEYRFSRKQLKSRELMPSFLEK